ncbi:MAG: helix-turn-helix domain-containing protein, partial [Desulfuromonadales bacterium]|nr:helix-turn-helix domain-containing protein [Desulfuromonadales bacterium]
MVDRANTEDSSELLIVDGRIGRFPERLKEGMNGKSARAFSHECELSDKMVRQYLSGQSEPTRPALIALADAANVRVEWLA